MKLWEHQQLTKERYQDLSGRAFNASDPGTGKTIATLAYAFENDLRTLILAPKTLLETAWKSDWEKFPAWPDVDVAWAQNRAKVFKSGVPNVITNIEGVNWLAKNPQYIKNFDLVVCDESTAFKNPASQRSKNAKQVFERIPQAINMSGTPMSKSVKDLWFQYLLIDNGARLGTNFTRFRYQFCTPERPPGAPPGAVLWKDKPGAADQIAELVADITVRYARDECMSIPDNQITSVEYDLEPELRKAYYEMMKTAALQLKSGVLLEAANAAVARNKLLQILTGSLYHLDGSIEELSSYRAELITDLIEAREASVVFYIWKHQRVVWEKQSKQRGLEVAFIDGTVSSGKRARIVQDFQAGKYRAIFLHPATGAHGLTLTRAKTVIFSTPPGDRPDWMTQGIARIVRGGQTSKTETILVSAKDTLEKRVYDSILEERDVGESFIDYVKELGE